MTLHNDIYYLFVYAQPFGGVGGWSGGKRLKDRKKHNTGKQTLRRFNKNKYNKKSKGRKYKKKTF